MNIAINALSASSYGGLHYLTYLLRYALDIDTENQYFIFVNKRNMRAFENNHPNCRLILIKSAGDNILLRFIWEQCILPFVLKKHKINVLYMPNGMDVFFSPTKTVICIQNMEPFFYKKFTNSFPLDVRSSILNFIIRISLRTSDKVIAVSGFVKDFLVRDLKIPDSKIECIYHGRDEEFINRGHRDNSRLEINNDYIFSASKTVAYANTLNLIRAFTIFVGKHKSDIMLIIAGGLWDKGYYKKLCDLVKAEGLEKRVRFLGYVAHPDMADLFWRSRIFVFPSKLEACPVTLIEAMTAGSAIISSNIGPMPEISTDAALYFNPDNAQELAEKIYTLNNDEALIKILRQKAQKRSEYFSWETSALKTKTVFEKAVNNV